MLRRSVDVWGEGDTDKTRSDNPRRCETISQSHVWKLFTRVCCAGPGESSLTAVGPSGIRDAVPLQLTSEAAKQLLNGLTPIADVALHQWGRVPTLRALVLGFIGRHIDSPALKVVPYLAPLPADIKACLLCVAR